MSLLRNALGLFVGLGRAVPHDPIWARFASTHHFRNGVEYGSRSETVPNLDVHIPSKHVRLSYCALLGRGPIVIGTETVGNDRLGPADPFKNLKNFEGSMRPSDYA